MLQSPLLITPKFSLVLCLFFVFVYATAFAVIFIVPVSFAWHLVLTVLLLSHMYYVMRRYLFYRHPRSVRHLMRDEKSSWSIQCGDETVQPAQLVQSALLSRYLVFVCFRVPGKLFPLSVPLAVDSEDKEVMRKLRSRVIGQPR